MSKNKSGGWRYQTLYIEHGTGDDEITREYTLCEVYLDKDGKLEDSNENHAMSPMGDSVDELIGTLQIMLEDAAKWEPVEFESMQVGMTFNKSRG
ncbi:MAG: hypothetical protein FWE24_01185 [Defluviitaleaceae bacterium]|nr:hypothetical protein [Defluviitaleaceae bacterium]